MSSWWEEVLTWVKFLWIKLLILDIAFFVTLVFVPQRFESNSFAFDGSQKEVANVAVRI